METIQHANGYYEPTSLEKIIWLKAFFKEYPLRRPINFRAKTDAEIYDLYYQYKGHCAIHNIKLTSADK